MMGEVKHTPGPWEVDGLLVSSRIHSVCLMGEPAQYPGDISVMCSNHKANAHLIAAAPDMYEALEEVMTWIKNWDPDFTEDEEWDETNGKVRAALAKARGEQ